MKDILDLIRSDKRFSLLAEILAASGIGEKLRKSRKVFTFFAPTNDALSVLPKSVLRLLRCAEGKDLAAAILGRHLVLGSYLYSYDLRARTHVTPAYGGKVRISIKNNALRFGSAPIHTPGFAARNGVVFPVDGVLASRR
ncbi:MAG TPA: fasciclin domain-containing protein [Pyrinomonadaceae bacterium]|nr:fasciclin domain-containing protein [Pyrinomonadaceae bacterium]